ncbi:MAG: LytTR family transcriptional regulator, partial [Paludibacteraceae bacterium]|nr:LytTR family transcriptional regulator [Paludibacteraceae bacterium]
IKLDTADILYIEAAKDYMRVVTTQKEYLTLVTLKQLIKSLPDTEFVKVHRSFVVNRRRIKILTTEGIVIGNRTIPVSDSMRGHILNVISNN